MKLGNKLLMLRKSKQLSQEEVAEKLEVTRQTISKWETDQSTPDFDKIVPLCELYGITPTELLMEGETEKKILEKEKSFENEEIENRKKKAKGIGLGVFLYIVSFVWIMISIPVGMLNPIVASGIFLLICGVATYIIIYVCLTYKKEKNEKEEQEDKLRRQISEIVAIITTIIYLIISFMTMAWHITWIIWIIYGLFDEILKLIFMLRGIKDEK